MPRTTIALLLLFLTPLPQLPHDPPKPLIPPFKLSTPPQPPPSDDLHDNSDWFSVLGNQEEEEAANAVPTQERQIPTSNFRILGIDLTPKMFGHARERFGKIHEVERGDAHYGRSQACYVSADGKSKIHLIFEQGEIDSTFYLFTGGPDWYGSDRCIPSKLITPRLATASGIRLGLTPAQVIAILGKPSRRSKTELEYSLHARKKTSPQERADFLRENPTLTAQEVDERFSTYDWGAGIQAKFTNSRLSFLSVSTSETN